MLTRDLFAVVNLLVSIYHLFRNVCNCIFFSHHNSLVFLALVYPSILFPSCKSVISWLSQPVSTVSQ